MNWLPVVHWLRGYDRILLRADVLAGITLAAYVLPAAIGDASLAGLPPEAGLYACLFAGLAFWAFCSSRYTAITVTSSISLLLGATLGDMAGGDLARYASLASCTALMVAALAIMTWLVKGGAVTSFISETVMVGFKAGLALHLASTQLPKLFGFAGAHGNFWERIRDFVSHLDQTNSIALLLGLAALAALVLGKKFAPKQPVGLAIIVGSILLAAVTNIGAHGVKLIGDVPQGLPQIELPSVHWNDLNDLLPLAMACFLLGAVETIAIGRMFALKHGDRLDTNQEFLALAAANIAVGLGHGFPVGGGMSQSLVNEGAGARTPLAGLIAALLVLGVTLFVSGLLRYLPQPVLAAVVLVAVAELLKIDQLKRLWRFSREEFAIALAALVGVLGAGLLRGVLIGAVLSIFFQLRRGARPQTTELGRVPGTEFFADRVGHPNNEAIGGVLVFRATGALLYFDVDYVRDQLFDMLNARLNSVKLVVFYMGAIPAVDLAGADLLMDVHRSLEERGITFLLANTLTSVRETLVRGGYEQQCGPIIANQPVFAVIRQWQERTSTNSA